MKHTLEPTADTAWVLEAKGYDALRESSVESRFAISNGFLGVRAARAITHGTRWVIPPRTYVAGLFDAAGSENAKSALVPAADWLHVRILLPGGPWVHQPDDVSSHRMALDMKRGVVLTEGDQLMAPGHSLRGRTLRLVSLSERAIGLQLIQFEFADGAADVTLEASFEGMTARADNRAARITISACGALDIPASALAMATAASLQVDGHVVPPTDLSPLQWSWTWKSHPGQVVWFGRLVAVARSDSQDVDPGRAARDKLGVAQQLGWRGVVAAHEAAWSSRWQCSDVEVDGDAAAQQALRFAVYHLNSAANPADERVSIGARALTGDEYRGHVFWDTEIYLLPFYILTWPEAARALLMYRFHTLDGARAKAAAMGWRGALYAWESADTGAETTPEQVIGPDRRVVDVLCGKQEQHISADVAYAVWQYWQATGDEAFLLDAGAEILLETGRFWSSRAQAGGGRSLPYPRRDRAGRISRAYRRQRLHQRHGTLEHPARDRCGGIAARALA